MGLKKKSLFEDKSRKKDLTIVILPILSISLKVFLNIFKNTASRNLSQISQAHRTVY